MARSRNGVGTDVIAGAALLVSDSYDDTALSKNVGVLTRTKHIDFKHHYILERVQKKSIVVGCVTGLSRPGGGGGASVEPSTAVALADSDVALPRCPSRFNITSHESPYIMHQRVLS
ncbi:hypothetical protein GN958_ATG18408 [Phytophthora infestans]|uniref:Uncharacterized protein n=1 Tax=Phytophthora infestans TaxID=4787 RepID=A0A8S9U2M0_PHYIN|nr:hypothetical protein GN958_ATG18408 [Phytophthora infestans]